MRLCGARAAKARGNERVQGGDSAKETWCTRFPARRVPFGAEQCISATLNAHSALHVWKQCTELALCVQHYAPCEEAFNSPNRGSPSFRRLPALPASHHSSNTVLPCSRAAISMFCYPHCYNLNFLALSRREIAR